MNLLICNVGSSDLDRDSSFVVLFRCAPGASPFAVINDMLYSLLREAWS